MRSNYEEGSGFPIKTVLSLVAGVFIVIFLLVGINKSVISVDAGEICVVQHPISGELEVYTEPGVHNQYWGTVTNYRRSFQYDFTSHKYTKDGSSAEEDRSIKVRFNDGGHGQLSGSVRIDLPLDKPSIVALHKRFGSQQALENDLIDKAITKSVYMSGPLMSSKESYAEKRNDLINYIADQAEHGIYKTFQKEIKQKDPISGEDKTVTVVEYVKDTSGGYARQEISPLETSHIGFSNLSILGLDYEADVEAQIKAQQKLTMQVQTAIATAKQAEQQAMTTVKEGEANAAKAKWEQEAIKAQAVTEAEQIKEVAKLNADAEEQNKRANILKGEGEGAYKRLVTQANNNFETRIAAWKEVNLAYAKAMEQSTWVPTYVNGGGNNAGGTHSSGAMDLIQLMTARTAKEFGVAGADK
jgi:hypothetical protein